MTVKWQPEIVTQKNTVNHSKPTQMLVFLWKIFVFSHIFPFDGMEPAKKNVCSKRKMK